jgi:chromosome segregation ATPase
MSTSNKSGKPKQRDPNTAPTTSTKSGVGNGGLADELKTLNSTVQRLVQNHSEEIQNIDNLKSEIKTLQTKVEEQEKDIAERENEEQVLFAKFQKQTTQWDAEKTRLNNELKSFKKQCEISSLEKVKEAEKKVRKAEADELGTRALLAKTERLYREAEAGRRGFQEQLEGCSSELDALKNRLGMLVIGGDLLVCPSFTLKDTNICKRSEIRHT